MIWADKKLELKTKLFSNEKVIVREIYSYNKSLKAEKCERYIH